MVDFLTFERFITQDILIVIYYFGVLFLPLLLWSYRETTIKIVSKMKINNLFLVFIGIILMELMWRMMFEAMIAYFDMHNYLQAISQNLSSKS